MTKTNFFESINRAANGFLVPFICVFVMGLGLTAPAFADPQRIALLGVYLQNDNEGYEATTDAERHRMKTIATAFKKQLEASGKYTFVQVSDTQQKNIDAGQPMGSCGGCEHDYGRDLKVDHVTWIRVQKISNLILNLNVYIADVSQQKVTFVHSVDLRGNTDESWTRGLTYLVQNYLLPNHHE